MAVMLSCRDEMFSQREADKADKADGNNSS